MSVRVWIDTDVGDNPDDAVALLLAAAHPWVDLVGVSTVRGDVELRARLAREVLAAADSDVLVYAGAPDPRALVAAEAMLAIGPLTNVAGLFDQAAQTPALCVMGGTTRPVQHRGELRSIETNFGADPAAARRVVEGAADLLVVPLDVTARMRLDRDELAELIEAAPILEPSVTRWLEREREHGRGDDASVCLHDPLALLALVGDETVNVEPMSLQVDAHGALIAGQDGGTWVDVVVDVRREVAVRRILDLLAAAGPDATGAQVH